MKKIIFFNFLLKLIIQINFLRLKTIDFSFFLKILKEKMIFIQKE